MKRPTCRPETYGPPGVTRGEGNPPRPETGRPPEPGGRPPSRGPDAEPVGRWGRAGRHGVSRFPGHRSG